MIKNCTNCKKEKELDEFYKSRIYKGNQYYTSRCKKCSDLFNKLNTKKYKSTAKYREHEKAYKKDRLKFNENLKEVIKLQKRESHKRCIAYNLWKRTKDRAEKRGLEFELLRSDILIPEICPILEIPIFVGTKENYKNSPTIDRIDNSKGYTKDNFKIISMLANTMKNSASKLELITFSKNIINYITNNDIVQTSEKSEES